MSRKPRLVLLFLCLAVLIVVGRVANGSFNFFLRQFWFTAGLLLLLLLSLVDQPFFSRDANIFINGTTAWVSLLSVEEQGRHGVWWVFFLWATYLILSSYALMLVRSRELRTESRATQFVSRLNRAIGRPEAIFSAFFLWGCARQFGLASAKLDALFLYWAVFMLLNLPAVAQSVEMALGGTEGPSPVIGELAGIISPNVAEVKLAPDLENTVGKAAELKGSDGRLAGAGTMIDDRVVAGRRIGRLALTSTGPGWNRLGKGPPSSVQLALRSATDSAQPLATPVSVVDVGTEIGKLVFAVHPNAPLQEGEVVSVRMHENGRAFYQIAARVQQVATSDGNCLQGVSVSAGQLGIWDTAQCKFEPVTWVPAAGEIVYATTGSVAGEQKIAETHLVVGTVPNSDFSVHVDIQDAVTHNTAIIGVTGSGKSYLAFRLIEAMVANGIKVLCLDLSRQHFSFLKHLGPCQLKQSNEVSSWLKDDQHLVGIHQYATANAGFPKQTAAFVKEVFNELSQLKLKAGVDEPARVCVVFEEAHSLIPEWNQVGDRSESDSVNQTARTILQGRKYGIGCLIITQRTANVTKTVLNQCNTIFAIQSFDQTGLDFLKNYMGEEYAHAISTLPTRHAILVGKASSSARPILFRIEDLSSRWKESSGPEQPVSENGGGAGGTA